MRTLAIGDIHGCLRALDLLLKTLRPGPQDLVVTLGDYVDRGPDSRGVVERLIELSASTNLISLRGNHEAMMLAARRDAELEREWRRVGGRETLASYGGSLEDVPEAHWKFFEETCVDFWEGATHFFVHANAYAGLPLEEQPEFMLLWEKFGSPAPHISGKVMVCGHTAQKSGRPLDIGHAVCLDTWAYGKGWLSALDVNSGVVWQARQNGEERRFGLDEA